MLNSDFIITLSVYAKALAGESGDWNHLRDRREISLQKNNLPFASLILLLFFCIASCKFGTASKQKSPLNA
jgi:hypothetical protein